MVIAIVGAAGMYSGYFLRAGATIARRVKPLPESWDVARSVRFCVGLMLFALLMTAVFAAAIGGPGALFRFYLGRTSTDFQQYVQTAAYFALSPVHGDPSDADPLHGVLARADAAADDLLLRRPRRGPLRRLFPAAIAPT